MEEAITYCSPEKTSQYIRPRFACAPASPCSASSNVSSNTSEVCSSSVKSTTSGESPHARLATSTGDATDKEAFFPVNTGALPCHLPRLPYVSPHEIRHRDYNYRDSNFNTRVRTRCGDFLTERRSSTTGRRHPNPAAVPGCNHDYRELNSKLRGHDGRAWLFHRRCSSSCCRSCLRQPRTPCRPAASLSEHRAGSERIRSRVSFCLSRRSPS